MFVAYDRAPNSRKTIYRLGTLALRLNDVDEASDCYEEFVKLAPKDPNQYILKYKILKARRAPLSEQIDALEELRIRVPKDVSVIGCDDIFYSGIRRLSLTTIDHFVALKGRDACDIIIRKIAINDQFYTGLQPTSLYNIEYTPKLITRKTTAYANMKKRK